MQTEGEEEREIEIESERDGGGNWRRFLFYFFALRSFSSLFPVMDAAPSILWSLFVCFIAFSLLSHPPPGGLVAHAHPSQLYTCLKISTNTCGEGCSLSLCFFDVLFAVFFLVLLHVLLPVFTPPPTRRRHRTLRATPQPLEAYFSSITFSRQGVLVCACKTRRGEGI